MKGATLLRGVSRINVWQSSGRGTNRPQFLRSLAELAAERARISSRIATRI
jgi:hypothetical protein